MSCSLRSLSRSAPESSGTTSLATVFRRSSWPSLLECFLVAMERSFSECACVSVTEESNRGLVLFQEFSLSCQRCTTL